jgi:hypothetical protein
MPYQEIICLVNSKMEGGKCVGGLKTDGSGWVRPVAAPRGGPLTPQQIGLQDGYEPRLLDLISIEITSPRPEPHQPENWVIGSKRWEFLKRATDIEFAHLFESRLELGPNLLGNQQETIPAQTFLRKPVSSSFALVAPGQH